MSNNDVNQRHFGMSTDPISCDDDVNCPECGHRAVTLAVPACQRTNARGATPTNGQTAREAKVSWSTPFVVVSANARRRRALPCRVRKMDSAQICERVPTASASTESNDVRFPDNRIREGLATTSDIRTIEFRDQLATTPSSVAITECRAGRSMSRDAATISERFVGGQHVEQGPRSTTKAGDERQLAPVPQRQAPSRSPPRGRAGGARLRRSPRAGAAQPEYHTECVGGEPEDSAAGGVSPWPAGYKAAVVAGPSRATLGEQHGVISGERQRVHRFAFKPSPFGVLSMGSSVASAPSTKAPSSTWQNHTRICEPEPIAWSPTRYPRSPALT